MLDTVHFTLSNSNTKEVRPKLWNDGVGLGVLAGGLFSEHLSYHWAFWVAAAVNTLGMAYYFLRVRGHFESNKLR